MAHLIYPFNFLDGKREYLGGVLDMSMRPNYGALPGRLGPASIEQP